MNFKLRKHFEEIIPLTDEELGYPDSFFKTRKLKKHQYLIQENELVTHMFSLSRDY